MIDFDIKKVITSEKLAKGAFGTIFPYRSINDPDDKQWVVKHIPYANNEIFLKTMEEVVLGFHLDHPAILPIKGYYTHADTAVKGILDIYIRLPRMEKSLKRIISERQERNEQFSEEEIIRILDKLVGGLEYLHGKGIAHRDIKPDNVMFNKQRDIKLIDLGIAKYIADDEREVDLTIPERNKGSPFYMAPELKNHSYELKNKHLFGTDVWGLGLIIAELCLLDPNYHNTENKETLFRRIETLMNEKYSQQLIDLIAKMIHPNTGCRASIKDVRETIDKNFQDILQRIAAQDQMPDQEEQKVEENEDFSNQIANIKREVQEKLNGNFEFIQDVMFGIRGNPSKIKNIQDRDVENLISQLKYYFEENNFHNLKFFALDLSCCSQITDETVMKLGGYINDKLKHLQHLELNFEKCFELQDKGICPMINNIALGNVQNPNLQNLTLNFNNCILICNPVIEILARNLADLKSIKQLTLGFKSCWKIDQEGFQKLALTLKNSLPNLRYLELNIQECQSLKEPAEEFRNLMMKRKDLELKIIT